MSSLAVLHIPHSSDLIPADLRSAIVVSDDVLAHELLVMTDRYTDELFAVRSPNASPVRFPVSRLVVDPERYLDDTSEPMVAQGMGVIYTQTSDGRVLRLPPSSSERSSLIARFYVPHHEALSTAIQGTLAECGVCLLLDCHSFPSQPIPCDLDQTLDRPDICLGTDRFNTPDWLVSKAQALFVSCGFTVGIDRPYSGVLIPAIHAGRSSNVCALMIEINRSLYMDEQTGDKFSVFPKVAEMIQKIVLNLIKETKATFSA